MIDDSYELHNLNPIINKLPNTSKVSNAESKLNLLTKYRILGESKKINIKKLIY